MIHVYLHDIFTSEGVPADGKAAEAPITEGT